MASGLLAKPSLGLQQMVPTSRRVVVGLRPLTRAVRVAAAAAPMDIAALPAQDKANPAQPVFEVWRAAGRASRAGASSCSALS